MQFLYTNDAVLTMIVHAENIHNKSIFIDDCQNVNLLTRKNKITF